MSEHTDRTAVMVHVMGEYSRAMTKAVSSDPPSKAKHNHHDSVLNALCPVCTPSAYSTNRARHRGYPRERSEE